jgi:hypothetical protein
MRDPHDDGLPPRHTLPYEGAEMREPTLMERRTFGVNVKLHPITEMPLEVGFGALPGDVQALQHCDAIQYREGKAAADAMRKKLADVKAMKTAQSTLAAAQSEVKKDGITVAP